MGEWGEVCTPPLVFIMHKFYVLPLEEVEQERPNASGISVATSRLCLHALIQAQHPEVWRRDLQELTEAEWEVAEGFVTQAILELEQNAGVIDGGYA